jgi:predicted ATPase
MRVHRLHIRPCKAASGFKNLIDFTIEFDPDSPTAVLVGRNGTGKSNVLEALTVIFRDLDLELSTPQFSYELEYTCHGRRILVDADPDRPSKKVQVSADGNVLTVKAFKENKRAYLPNYVFGYYSGPSNRMQEHFIKHQERFYNELISSADDAAIPLRPLFFARHIHSQFVLLAFFLEQDQTVLKFLDEQLGITGLNSVLFVMKQPPWNSREGDERFWLARGVVAALLDRLYTHTLAPMRHKWRVPLGFRKTTELEHLYLYLPNATALNQLKAGYATQQDFFKALESTYISELMREVRTRVETRCAEAPLTFRELSEGEQQLLMVLGLLRFTREEESLFLLDEPDTHLNPAWSVQYLEFLKTIGGLGDNSHLILATHDPLVISGLTRQQVRIMRRDAVEAPICAEMPETDPQGMGVNGLLRSELYGLRSALDLPTLKKIDERDSLRLKQKELQAKGKDLSPENRIRLIHLSKELSDLGLSRDFRNPVEQQFADAMARHKGHKQPVTLTQEQMKQQQAVADEILKEILAEENK